MKKISLLIIAAIAITLNLIAQETGTFIDSRDGQEYNRVKIGKQVWMAENLRYLPMISYYHNEVSPKSSTSDSLYLVFGYKGKNVKKARKKMIKKYGAIYNLSAALTACPKGWHLPDISEWEALLKFVNDEMDDDTIFTDVANYLKS